MIQRIQTLYLFVVSALMAVTLFVPLAWFAGDAGEFRLCAFALREVGGQAVQPTLYMGVLLAVACALPLVTLFLFRRRLLQFRLCVAEAVLLVGAAVMEGVYYFLSWRVFSGLTFHLQGVYVSIALPVVCLVFVWLAARARRVARPRCRPHPLRGVFSVSHWFVSANRCFFCPSGPFPI